MTPTDPLYFDYSQSENEDSLTIGGFNPLEKVYAYDPVPEVLSAAEGEFILGAQANLWTEYIDNPRKVEYMLFPRIAALSEILWTPLKNKSWEHFTIRLNQHFERYKQWNLGYSRAYFDLAAAVLPSPDNKGVTWRITKKSGEGVIRINDSIRSDNPSATYFDFPISEKSKVKDYKAEWILLVQDKNRNVQLADPVKQSFHFNKATGKRIVLKNPPSKKYPGDGAFTLVNGVRNEKGLARKKEFLGFEGGNCEVTIDLGEKTAFDQVILHTLTETGSWIYPPRSARFEISDDGIHFVSPAGILTEKDTLNSRRTVLRSPTTLEARFVRLFIENFGAIPAGKPGAGSAAWLFVDEVEIN
jgi:hexosaminidase